MASNNNSREERRRRIIERGSNRMVLITGHANTLLSSSSSSSSLTSPPPPPPPPSPSSSSPTLHHVPHTQPSLFSHLHHASIPDHQINTSSKGKDDASDSTFLKHEISDDISGGIDFEIGSQGETQLNKCVTSIEAIQTPLDDSIKVQPSLGTSMVQRTSIDREPHQKLRRHQPKLFTSKQLNSCIIASETTRITCVLIIAFLVVLSYVDYPLFGRNIVKSESVVASRPLYILLLTDITIVLARLHLENRRGSEEAEEEKVASLEDGHSWTKAEKVLERGLVVYQAIRAIFIDCSVYLVIVICGLSLV